MSAPLVLRRNFSLFGRVPHARLVLSAARHGHERILIQRVRIGRPFLSKSRLVGAVAIGAATYGLASLIGVVVELEEVKEGQKKSTRSGGQPGQDGWTRVGPEVDDQDDDEEDDEEDDDHAILFIPTGISRERPKEFYKGSDPEWQEFKKLATDRPRIAKIRGELVGSLRSIFAKSPVIVAKLGKIDTTKGKAWIEVKFPEAAPPEFERPGIELLEDLSWRTATRPVDSAAHTRLMRVLYPKEVATALYNDTTTKVASSWKAFKIYMGWSQVSKTEAVQQLVQRISANPRSAVNPTTSVAPNPISTSTNATQQPGVAPSAVPADGATKNLDRILRIPLVDLKKMTLDLTQFKAECRKTLQPYPDPVPRGAFWVFGLFELCGERAKLTVHVHAMYDPKQNRYLGIRTNAYNFAEKRQFPKGGP